MTEKLHIIPHSHKIRKEERNKLNGHKSIIIWFTGLSGSGKSTIADRLDQILYAEGIHTYVLDGDNVRDGLNKGLGFSDADRNENLRRVAEVAKIMVDAGIVVLSAFVSPLINDRTLVKDIVGETNFVEIFVNTSLEECERRDVKGLYKKARAGEISNFTGISAPYESPINPAIEIKTENLSVDDAAISIRNFLFEKLNIKK